MYSRMIKVTVQALVFATPFIAQLALATAPGTLDSAFSTDGMLMTDFTPRQDIAYGVAQQADGKLVLVGQSVNGADGDFALARYNSDGSLDGGFAAAGLLRLSFAGSDTGQANSVIQLASGKLVVVGTATISGNDQFVITRYTTGGSLDGTFGSYAPGVEITAVGAGTDRAMAVLERSDHKIMVAGFSNSGGTNSYDFALVRYTSGGILDTFFDTDGKVTTDIALGEDKCTSMIQQVDGKILLAGYATVAGAHNFALVRYNGSTGVIDNGFSSDGKVTTSFGGTDEIANAVMQQADGKLVVVGYTNKNGDSDIAIARYNLSGSLDNTFSGDGKVVTNISGSRDDSATAVIQQWDGKLIVAGSSAGAGNDVVYFLARYNTDGTLDTTFDGDGILTTSVGSAQDYAYNMIAQADGQVVVVGGSYNGSDYDFSAVRYLFDDDDGDGILDDSDNCQYVANADQLNTDLASDGGNACDSDDDDDGVADSSDDFPLNVAASVDSDGDGMPDNWNVGCDATCQTGSGLTLDADDDNDGTPDVSDPFPLDPFLWSRIDGNNAGDYMGYSVASIGDLNADGFDEILVGAPKKDVTLPLAIKASADVGAVYVYSGQTGLVMSPVLQGSMAGDQYGLVVAAAGDVNNDGTPDFMVGVPYADGTDPITLKAIRDRGRVYVYSGADFSEIFHVDGDAASDGFGISLAAAGDVNVDTYDDILIGAWKADVTSGLVLLKDAGAAYLYAGSASTPTLLNKFNGAAAGDYFGYSVAAGSDLDHDTIAELIIGAYKHDTVDPITLKALSDVGSVYLYSSASPYVFVNRLDGSLKGDYFGFALGVVDAGGDAYADLLVGTPYADIPAIKILKDAGKVQLFNNNSGSELYHINGTQAGALFGYSICAVGDIDNIGINDFVVGAPKMDTIVSGLLRKDAGQLTAHRASDSTQFFALDGENASGLMGNAIAGGGDYNNDGNTDLIVASPLYDVTTLVPSILKDAGRVEVLNGKITQ